MKDDWNYDRVNQSVASKIRHLENRNNALKKSKVNQNDMYRREYDENSGALYLYYSLANGICLQSRGAYIRRLEDLRDDEDEPAFDSPLHSIAAVRKGWNDEIRRLLADLKES